MSGNNKPNRVNEDADVVSWILTVIMLAINPFPFGLGLLISKVAGFDILGKLFTALMSSSKSSKQVNRSSFTRSGVNYSNSSSQSRAARSGYQQGQQVKNAQTTVHTPSSSPAAQPQPVQPQYSSQRHASDPQSAVMTKPQKEDDGIQHISKGKKVLFIFGWIILAAGIIGGIASITGTGTIWRVLQWIAVAVGGGGLLMSARTKDRKERLYQNIVKLVGDKSYIDLKALASSAGIKEKKLIRELDEMVERGYLPKSAYLDNARGLLILDDAKAAESINIQKPHEPAREDDKYDLLLKEMERACGRIHDRDMLEKAVQIRGLAAAVFDAVREDPDKQPQISSFLNYYFPTTLKLLDSYADFEEKGYQGDKLSQTKDRIEATMDTIISAYRKQLDNLYLPDTLDVDTDIDVLETMLKRDGLSESDFEQSKNNEKTLGTTN